MPKSVLLYLKGFNFELLTRVFVVQMRSSNTLVCSGTCLMNDEEKERISNVYGYPKGSELQIVPLGNRQRGDECTNATTILQMQKKYVKMLSRITIEK